MAVLAKRSDVQHTVDGHSRPTKFASVHPGGSDLEFILSAALSPGFSIWTSTVRLPVLFPDTCFQGTVKPLEMFYSSIHFPSLFSFTF